MKRIFCITCAIALGVMLHAAAYAHPYAEHSGQRNLQGGYVGPSSSAAGLINISDAIKLKDESYVTLKGNIVSKSEHEKYILKDATGSILVEIDDDIWMGLKVKASDTVIVEGDIDRDWNGIKVDVDRIMLATPAVVVPAQTPKSSK